MPLSENASIVKILQGCGRQDSLIVTFQSDGCCARIGNQVVLRSFLCLSLVGAWMMLRCLRAATLSFCGDRYHRNVHPCLSYVETFLSVFVLDGGPLPRSPSCPWPWYYCAVDARSGARPRCLRCGTWRKQCNWARRIKLVRTTMREPR